AIGRHTSRTDAVRKQELRNEIEVIALGDLQIELQVLAASGPSGGKCRIIAAHFFDAASANQGRAAGQEISKDQSRIDIASTFARRDIEEHPVPFIDRARPTVDQANLIPSVPHDCYLLLDLVRMPEIVSVDWGNELSTRMRNSIVAS